MNLNTDIDTVSSWFVLKSGFKVHGRCPQCHSTHLTFFKNRIPGLTGISPSSEGISPACLNCGKNLPGQGKKAKKLSKANIIKCKMI